MTGNDYDLLYPYGQKIPNACQRSLRIQPRPRAGRWCGLARVSGCLRRVEPGWLLDGVNLGIGLGSFLTIRDYAGMRLGEIQRIEYFLVDAVVL